MGILYVGIGLAKNVFAAHGMKRQTLTGAMKTLGFEPKQRRIA
jgi:hypothetical protein